MDNAYIALYTQINLTL